jgi:hypothetical protein
MSRLVQERGEVRPRLLFEVLLLFVIAYSVFQVGPAVKLRIDFLNEMEVGANAPIGETELEIKAGLLKKAELLGITIISDNLFVRRDVEASRTLITAIYQIHIGFWPHYIYVWHVEDRVEGYLF